MRLRGRRRISSESTKWVFIMTDAEIDALDVSDGLRDLGDRLARGETIEATRLVRCPRCHGDGYHVIDGTCPNCGGLGVVRRKVELTARRT